MSKLNKWFESTRIYWFTFELIKTLSNEPSYFSKKRIESFTAFVIGQIGMVYYLIEHIQTMTSTDIGGMVRNRIFNSRIYSKSNSKRKKR